MATALSGPAKRLQNELADVARNPLPPFLLRLGLEGASDPEADPDSDDDVTRWTAVMRGAPGSAYEHGRWQLAMRAPEGYPMKPPAVRFVTHVCHPNVDFKTGEICLDLLKDAWAPTNTILSTLEAIHYMLAYPEPDSPLNVDVAVLMRSGDLVGAESLIRWCCNEWRWEEPRRTEAR